MGVSRRIVTFSGLQGHKGLFIKAIKKGLTAKSIACKPLFDGFSYPSAGFSYSSRY
jgi:hypothetical protein